LCPSVPASEVGMKLDEESIARLGEIGLFGGLGRDALRGFVGDVEVAEMSAGSIVFKEGDSGREMFLILDGEIEVLRRSKRGHEPCVAMLGPGDWFGEMSILDVLPRSATTRVLSPARLLRLSAHDLDALYRKDMKAYALFVLNVAREMSRRLRVADGLLAE